MTERIAPIEASWASVESRLRAYVRRRIDPSAAEDVVGDILLRLVQHRGELAAARNPLAWALRVAGNVLTDHYRRRDMERRGLSRFRAEADHEAEVPLKGGSSATAEMSRCLVPFIENLPEPYREALLLTDIEGLTQREAAARAGISLSGMKARVQRGRKRLKRALLRCCAIELDRRGGIVDYQRRGGSCGRPCGGGPS